MVEKASEWVRIAVLNYVRELQGRSLISSNGACWIELSSVKRVECGNREEAVLRRDIMVDIVPVRAYSIYQNSTFHKLSETDWVQGSPIRYIPSC